MDSQQIERQFNRIGARVRIYPPIPRPHVATPDISIDIGRDPKGELFFIAVQPGVLDETRVIDVQPSLRHLLLMSVQEGGKHKFLCGHDERHWFVAAVPERANVSSVRTAFDALKPPEIHWLEQKLGVKHQKRNHRRNDAFVRQGEWFFVPLEQQTTLDLRWMLRNEPISRGRGKPHICEELVRLDGELVYVSNRYPQGLTESEHSRMLDRNPKLRHLHWVAQRRNPMVYVRGRVRHPDHKTNCLVGWHQVMMNTEYQSLAMRHVAFLD